MIAGGIIDGFYIVASFYNLIICFSSLDMFSNWAEVLAFFLSAAAMAILSAASSYYKESCRRLECEEEQQEKEMSDSEDESENAVNDKDNEVDTIKNTWKESLYKFFDMFRKDIFQVFKNPFSLYAFIIIMTHANIQQAEITIIALCLLAACTTASAYKIYCRFFKSTDNTKDVSSPDLGSSDTSASSASSVSSDCSSADSEYLPT